MLFNSLPFLIFLPAVVILYYLLPSRTRWLWVLLASYFFYGFWKVEYLSLILISTTVDYFCARHIHKSESSIQRKLGLAISLTTNLGLLAFFKYAGWFTQDVLHASSMISDSALEGFATFWDFALPVGISFYTFQTLGYTIDVYYKRAVPEKNPLKFALFVSYFPQLVAGPIERFSHLHSQLFKERTFTYRSLQHGGRLILYGLFIKMCIADNAAPLVDEIFDHVEDASRAQLALGALLFGLQIYADFHGYSLIAIGTARLMGVELMDNFKTPYTSTSIREFWGRWHISLSTWFRDYLYLPLGGSRVSHVKLAANIMVVFTVSGLWHGANWTFVVWGALHGLAYLAERWFIAKDTAQWLKLPKWMATMAVVFVAWVFFRSPDLEHASTYILGMIQSDAHGMSLTFDPMFIAMGGLFVLSDLRLRDSNFDAWAGQRSPIIRWCVYALMLYFILGYAGVTQHPFIYFQF